MTLALFRDSDAGNVVPLNLSRRAFITNVAALTACSAIAVVPYGAHAQQPASPRRIGSFS